MRADEGDRPDAGGLDHHFDGRPRFEVEIVGQRVNDGLSDGEAGEDGFAVLPALVRHGLAKGVMHAAELCEPLRLIDARSPLGAAVHLLQGDDVRLKLLDDAGEPVVIKSFVRSFAVVDIVGEHAKRLGRLRLDRPGVTARCEER